MSGSDTYSAKVVEMQRQLEEMKEQERRGKAEADRRAEVEKIEEEERAATKKLEEAKARRLALLAAEAEGEAVYVRRRQEVGTSGGE
jgi:hypothetical protein